MAAINRRYIDSGLDVGRGVEVAGWVLSRGKGRASITSLRGGRLEAGWPHSLKSQEGEFEGGARANVSTTVNSLNYIASMK